MLSEGKKKYIYVPLHSNFTSDNVVTLQKKIIPTYAHFACLDSKRNTKSKK